MRIIEEEVNKAALELSKRVQLKINMDEQILVKLNSKLGDFQLMAIEMNWSSLTKDSTVTLKQIYSGKTIDVSTTVFKNFFQLKK
jgi:imidazoleglycerol phosphate dehydratase HisB